MSDNGEKEKLVFKAVIEDNNLKITLGNMNEALLSLALRKTALYIDNVLIQNEVKKPVLHTPIIAGTSILDKIRGNNG